MLDRKKVVRFLLDIGMPMQRIDDLEAWGREDGLTLGEQVRYILDDYAPASTDPEPEYV